MLEEEDAFWWEAIQRISIVGRQVDTVTWVEFIDVFNNSYYLEQVCEQKVIEFTNLKQDMDQMVMEYEHKFIQHEHFTPSVCASRRLIQTSSYGEFDLHSKSVWPVRDQLQWPRQ